MLKHYFLIFRHFAQLFIHKMYFSAHFLWNEYINRPLFSSLTDFYTDIKNQPGLFGVEAVTLSRKHTFFETGLRYRSQMPSQTPFCYAIRFAQKLQVTTQHTQIMHIKQKQYTLLKEH